MARIHLVPPPPAAEEALDILKQFGERDLRSLAICALTVEGEVLYDWHAMDGDEGNLHILLSQLMTLLREELCPPVEYDLG